MPRPNYEEKDLQMLLANLARGKRVGATGTRPDRAMPAERAKNIADTETAGGANPPLPPSAYAPYKSNLERAWAQYLDALVALSLIDGWLYEPVNFKLPGEKNYYKIDFETWKDKAVTYFEVKGRNRSDERSLVKMKTAAGLHPWATFVLVRRIKGAWHERIIR